MNFGFALGTRASALMVETKKSLRIWGAIPLVLFVTIYSGCAELTELRCSRAAGVCVLSHETLVKRSALTFKLDDLLGAHKEGSSSGRSSTGHSFLDTRQGAIPFEIWGSNSSANISSSVRQFLKSQKQRELIEVHDSRLNVFGAASFLLLASIILLWLSLYAPQTVADQR